MDTHTQRKRRFPYTLLILPLFLLALGTLLYTANNRTMFPTGPNPYTQSSTITPVLTPASGQIQVGVGGGGPVTPTGTITPTATPTPTLRVPTY